MTNAEIREVLQKMDAALTDLSRLDLSDILIEVYFKLMTFKDKEREKLDSFTDNTSISAYLQQSNKVMRLTIAVQHLQNAIDTLLEV